MRNFELIVFDWDGTLMDSTLAIVNAMRAASRDLDLPEPSDAKARQVIGLGLAEALATAVPQLTSSRYDEMVARYRYHYLARDQELNLFDGAQTLLERLAKEGYRLAVATGKSRHGLTRAWAHTGVRPLFHASRCADECFSKPHPQMLHELMDELGTQAEATLMIGDTAHDLMMANNAGVAALGVSYGAHPVAHLTECEPLACVHSVEELDSWLLQHG